MSPSGCVFVAHREAHQVDHLLGQIANSHRLAHVEHEHVAARAHRARLNHQRGGLGNRHEVAVDLGMRDGDRSAVANLLAEQRHHRARRSQHVAESDHRERRARAALVETLQHELGETLGRAHDVRRQHGFVGRDQHERLHAGGDRGLGRMQRAEHVVVHALDHVVLDERHVLVGGRVIDGLDLVSLEHLAHALVVMRRADQGDDLDVQRVALSEIVQRLIDRVERCLREVQVARAVSGPSRAICTQSSEPIEPPAPVTITDLPRMQASSSLGFGGTASRPKRSVMSTSRISSTRALPAARSAVSGMVCTCTGSCSSWLMISRRRRRETDGNASSTRVHAEFFDEVDKRCAADEPQGR